MQMATVLGPVALAPAAVLRRRRDLTRERRLNPFLCGSRGAFGYKVWEFALLLSVRFVCNSIELSNMLWDYKDVYVESMGEARLQEVGNLLTRQALRHRERGMEKRNRGILLTASQAGTDFARFVRRWDGNKVL